MYLKQYWKVIVTLIVVLVILGGITYSFISPFGFFAGLSNDLKAIAPTSEAAAYTDLNGVPVDLSQFKGKPLIINAWATWTPFSATELPLLTSVKVTHGDAINVIAINRMEQTALIRSFLTTFSIPETLVFLTDPTDYFYTAVGGFSMPETLFYSSDGVLVAHKRGVLTESELQELVKSITE